MIKTKKSSCYYLYFNICCFFHSIYILPLFFSFYIIFLSHIHAEQTTHPHIHELNNSISEKKLLDDTLLIFVTDHGETKGGHGGNSKEESSAVLGVRGHSVNKMNFDSNTRNRDVAAIVLYALGIDIPNHFVSKVPNNLFGEAR